MFSQPHYFLQLCGIWQEKKLKIGYFGLLVIRLPFTYFSTDYFI